MRSWFIRLLLMLSLVGCSTAAAPPLDVSTIDFDALIGAIELPFGLAMNPASVLKDPLIEAEASGVFDITGIPAPQKMFSLNLDHANPDPSGSLELMVYSDSNEAKKTYAEFRKINSQFDNSDLAYSSMSLHCHVVVTTAVIFDQNPPNGQAEFDSYIQKLESQMNQTFCNQ